MIAPRGDWTWVGGKISHFDLEAMLRTSLANVLTAMHEGTFTPTYNHGARSSDLPPAQESAFCVYLTADEDLHFEYPLPGGSERSASPEPGTSVFFHCACLTRSLTPSFESRRVVRSPCHARGLGRQTIFRAR